MDGGRTISKPPVQMLDGRDYSGLVASVLLVAAGVGAFLVFRRMLS